MKYYKSAGLLSHLEFQASTAVSIQ